MTSIAGEQRRDQCGLLLDQQVSRTMDHHRFHADSSQTSLPQLTVGEEDVMITDDGGQSPRGRSDAKRRASASTTSTSAKPPLTCTFTR